MGPPRMSLWWRCLIRARYASLRSISLRRLFSETTFVDLMAVHQGDSSEGEALSLVKVAGDADAFVLVLQCFGELDASGNLLTPRLIWRLCSWRWP